MRLGNPAVRRALNKVENGEYSADPTKASYKGVYGKTALYAAATLLAAVGTYTASFCTGEVWQYYLIAAGISLAPSVIIAFIISFCPSSVKVLGFVYAILQGGFLGVLSAVIDILIMPGIALAALLGTLSVFGISVFAHNFLKVRISNGFLRGLLIAFICILLVQFVMFLVSFTGFFSYTAYIWLEIAASTVCILWATVMISFDLNSIDCIVLGGADKTYEWYFAFSLVSTLIYMYVEILELIVRIAALFMKDN